MLVLETEDQCRCRAAEACTEAIARGSTGGLISLVIDLYLERLALQARIRRLEICAGLTRDTLPCEAPEEGGP